MKPVFEKHVSQVHPSELSVPTGYANNEQEASGLDYDARRRYMNNPKPREFVHAEHPSGVAGFFPKKKGR